MLRRLKIKDLFQNVKEYFLKVIKSKGASSFLATLLAISFGLIFGFIVMLIASPEDSISGFFSMVFAGFSRIGNVLYFATPIIMTGLSVGFAFKMGLFNIGASGQYTMGMFFALYVGFMIDLPPIFLFPLCILAGLIGGMLWGFIPGILKSHLNVNEVITSIMTNYIGLYLVDMLIMSNSKIYDSSRARTNYLSSNVQFKSFGMMVREMEPGILKNILTDLFNFLGIMNSNVNFAFFIAVIIAIILYIVLYKTIFGYELIATGLNKHASNYAGINYKRNTIITMMIAGGLSGLGGAFAIMAPSGIPGSSMTYEPINIIAANGFNGIAVALLGNSHPIGIVFSGLFISHIQRGGTQASMLGYKPEIIDVVIAVIIYFSAFALVMKTIFGKVFHKWFIKFSQFIMKLFNKLFKKNKNEEA